MFITYADYVRAAMQLLQDKPKGMGYCSGTGVVFLIAGALHYVEEGECIEDANVGDLSEWDEASSINEFRCLRSPELVQRFAPSEVLAYEQNLGLADGIHLSAECVCL